MQLEPWRRTLYAVAIAQFIALGGGNLVFPFIPFYVEDLGITGESQIALWSGLLTTATGAMLFVFSPIWGSLADRYGRKPLLLRAYVGAMITMTLQGLAMNVWQFLALRALQGIFVGTIPAATALVAASSPRDKVAYSLGVLQMALFSSQFIGPLVGGALAASIGIRTTFIGASAFYLLAFVLVFFAVEEKFERPTDEERGSFVSNMRLVFNNRALVTLIVLVFFLNAGPAFVRPVIPLLVASFESARSPEALAGIAFAAMAITSAVSALSAGRLTTTFGGRNTLALLTFCAGAAYLPLALTWSLPLTMLLLAGVGLFTGAMLPTANTLIDGHAPPGKQASVFGVAGSAFALAVALGPLSGGAVASAAGISASFVVIALVMIAVGVGVLALVTEARPAREPEVEPEPAG